MRVILLTGELLKSNTLNGINRVLRLFAHYIEETGQGRLLMDIPNEPGEHLLWLWHKEQGRALLRDRRRVVGS